MQNDSGVIEITVLSGKGGAGKTSVTAAIAAVAKNVVFCDTDVDAADLHLIFDPVIRETIPFSSGSKAVIDPGKCTDCRWCIDHCRFEAIHINAEGLPEVNPFQCEGCRLCERICPEKAISSIAHANNRWFISDTRFGPLVHARMGAGEENSGKLVTVIRKKAREIAADINADYIISDGPPGIGCPVIASVTGTGAVLMVVEPTLSGLHDAKRLLELITPFSVPLFALINKSDINPEITIRVERFLSDNAIPLIEKIPFDNRLVEAMVEGKSITEFVPGSELSAKFTQAWRFVIDGITK